MSHAAAEQINIKAEKQEKILAMALLYLDVVLRGEPDYILTFRLGVFYFPYSAMLFCSANSFFLLQPLLSFWLANNAYKSP